MRQPSLLLLALVLALALAPPLDALGRLRNVRDGPRRSTLHRASSYTGAFRAARQLLEGQSYLVQLRGDLPTVVIPDLHARQDYLDRVLDTRDPVSGSSYLDLLRQGRVQVVCLGDVMHTENSARFWHGAVPEHALRTEMAMSLNTLQRVAQLKVRHPEHFHMLRGNHEDLGPAIHASDCRLPLKIVRTRSALREILGQPTVAELERFFCSLPLAATGKGFVASHAAPMVPLTRADVERGTDRAQASLARVRTASFRRLRRQSQRMDQQSTLQQVASALGADPQHDYYLHGHRWARPMTIRGREVFFGDPTSQTFLRLDPGSPVVPQDQLFEAGSGRRIVVPTQRGARR